METMDNIPPCPQFTDNVEQTLIDSTFQHEPHSFTLSGTNPLVSIAHDGTVTIHQPGAEVEAAKVFWGAVSDEYRRMKTALEQIQQLESYEYHECVYIARRGLGHE